jgi:hypothetical protein
MPNSECGRERFLETQRLRRELEPEDVIAAWADVGAAAELVLEGLLVTGRLDDAAAELLRQYELAVLAVADQVSKRARRAAAEGTAVKAAA